MITPVDLAIYDGDRRLPLVTWRGDASFGHGEHGYESCRLALPLTRDQAYDLYLRLSGTLRAVATAGGDEVWEGRIEDVEIANGEATVTAFGRWRALRDVPYTAVWSDAQLGGWRELTPADRPARLNQRFVFNPIDTGGLVIALKQGMDYSNVTLGSFGYEAPSGGARSLAGIQFTLTHNLPATYRFRVIRYTGGFAGTPTVVSTVNGAGALVTTASYANWSPNACDAIELVLDYNSGVATTYTGQDGDNYVLITDLRVVSTVENRITGTLGTAVAAPGAATVTPSGGTDRIYVGQKLVVIGADPEMVTVTAVTATTFDAVFAYAHLAADLLRGFVVYADEVARAFRDATNAANAGALSDSDALIQSPGLDLLNLAYEDADMGDVLTRLAALGGADGQRWEVGVTSSRRLYLRPRGDATQAWFVNLADLRVQQTLDQLYNSVYARYKAASGRTLRTAAQNSTESIVRYALTRRRSVDADTTSDAVAARIAQTSRDDTKDVTPRASFEIVRLRSAGGADAPPWVVRPGDTITITNLAPVYGSAIDKVRTFTVMDCELDLATGVLSVVPETPLPELEYQLARLAALGPAARGPFADTVP